MVNTADARPVVRHRPSAWVVAAGVIMIVQGALGLLNAPALAQSSLGLLHPLLILVVTLSGLSVAAGIGLFRLQRWARRVAVALTAFTLVAFYLPGLVTGVAGGGWTGFDWPGFAGALVVLYAALWRWPGRRAPEVAASVDPGAA